MRCWVWRHLCRRPLRTSSGGMWVIVPWVVVCVGSWCMRLMPKSATCTTPTTAAHSHIFVHSLTDSLKHSSMEASIQLFFHLTLPITVISHTCYAPGPFMQSFSLWCNHSKSLFCPGNASELVKLHCSCYTMFQHQPRRASETSHCNSFTISSSAMSIRRKNYIPFS